VTRFNVKTFDDLLAEYVRERGDPAWKPIQLGFGTLDTEMRGVSPGQVCAIAARAGVGKTFLLNSVLHNFARLRPDSAALNLSLEMPAVEWLERQLAMHENVAPEEVEHWARQNELAGHSRLFLERMQHALICDSMLRLNEVQSVIAEARSKLPADVPLRLVLVDYLGLIGTEGRSDYERASAIGRGLKEIAKAESVAIVVAAQLSRAAGDGSEPVALDMLRDSGVIEEAADFVIGCWRPGEAKNIAPAEADELENTLRVRLLKNRKGKQGRIVDLAFGDPSRKVYEPADPFAALEA
jgi:replicative DNA helicase